MSDLQNLTPANTYKALLQLDAGYTNGISGSTGANALQVSDGAGNNTSLALSTNRVGIGNTSPSAELDVSGDVVADEYALDQTGSSSSAVAIHAPAPNELAIRTNTAERVRVDSSGNVGIGTTTPQAVLDVDGEVHLGTLASGVQTHTVRSGGGVTGNVGNGVKLIPGSAPTTDQYISFYTGTSTPVHIASIGSVGDDLLIRTRDNSSALFVEQSGNVGIGTTSPSAPLEVSSTTGGVIMPRMTTTQMNAISSPTDGEMIYNTTANKFYGRANGAWVALH